MAGGRGTKHNMAVQGPSADVMDRTENGSQRRDTGQLSAGIQMGMDLHAPHPHLIYSMSQPSVIPVPGTIHFKALLTHWVGFHSLLEGGYA